MHHATILPGKCSLASLQNTAFLLIDRLGGAGIRWSKVHWEKDRYPWILCLQPHRLEPEVMLPCSRQPDFLPGKLQAREWKVLPLTGRLYLHNQKASLDNHRLVPPSPLPENK